MKRWQQHCVNREAIKNLEAISLINRYKPPSYAQAVVTLNRLESTTSRGNSWTPKRLFRMLQRNGISGLHGLCASLKEKS